MFARFEPAVSRPKLKLAIAALILLPFANPSNATQVTSNFSVQLTMTTSCVINSASALNFGSQGVLVADVDNTSTLQVQCTNTTPYNIGLDIGTGIGATVAARKMTSGSNTINYSLYQDSARSVLWGNTVGTDTVAGVGSGIAQSYTVYGRVPAQSTPGAGAYADKITVTVTY
jgi:spore coat protein U-like protein